MPTSGASACGNWLLATSSLDVSGAPETNARFSIPTAEEIPVACSPSIDSWAQVCACQDAVFQIATSVYSLGNRSA
jgi:hypothetical protein